MEGRQSSFNGDISPHTVVPVKAQGLGALIALSTLVWLAIALFADLIY